MEKKWIFGRVIPMSCGRCPWIRLPPTLKSIIDERLKNEEEIVLDNLFEPILKTVSLVNWPRESGILPPN